MKCVTYKFFVRHHPHPSALNAFLTDFGVKRVPIADLVNWLQQDQHPQLWEAWCLSLPNVPFVRAMLVAGANVHACGDLALCIAAHYGYVPIVKFLLAAGADVHAYEGEPLHTASFRGRLKIVELLLAAGANPYDDEALQSALEYGHTRIAAVLRKAMAA